MILRGSAQQASAIVLYHALHKRGINPQLIDASRVASGLEKENIKSRFKQLAANRIKRKILKEKNSILYINRSSKIQASALSYLDSDYFSITLAASLGTGSCDFFMDSSKIVETLTKIKVPSKETLSLSYQEATEIADIIRDKGISAGLIRYAKERNVSIHLKDLHTGKCFIFITHNQKITKGVVKWIRPLTHLAKIHIQWQAQKGYDPAKLLSHLAEAKINLYHLHYAFLAKPKAEMRFFVEKKDLENLAMIVEYQQKDTGHLYFERDSNLGIVELVGDELDNTALISVIVNKTLRKEKIEFSFLESRPGKISLLVGGDHLKLSLRLLQDEFG